MENPNTKPSDLLIDNQQDDGDIIDLKELFFALLEHWKSITLSTLLVALIAFSISKFILIPQYSSTSQLYVLSKSTSITSLSDIQMGTSLTNDYISIVTDRPILERVILNLGLDMKHSTLKSKISVSNPSNSRLLNITITDADPEMAKTICDEMANVVKDFISEKMDQDPPSVISYGYSDGNPVSPNTKKNTLLGAAVGFILATVLAIFRTIINDTIKTPDDIESKLGIRILGTVPFEEKYTKKGGKKKQKFVES